MKKPKSKSNAWPSNTKKVDVTRALANAKYLANNATASIGDSLESRLTSLYLGGGSDFFDGNFGYTGEFLGQSIYDGEESTQRGAPALSALSRMGNRDETTVAKLKIKLCNAIYDNDGQVASIVDLMADFASEGLKFAHSQASVQKFYDSWAQKVNLKSRFRNAIIQLIVSGNTFLYKVYAKLSSEEERAMKTYTIAKSVGDKLILSNDKGEHIEVSPKIEYDSSMAFLLQAGANKSITNDEFKERVRQFVIAKIKNSAEKIMDTDIKPGTESVVPWKYIMLNPLQIKPLNGSWVYLLTKEDVAKLLDNAQVAFDDEKKSLKVTLPGGMTGQIKQTKEPGFYAEMSLSLDRLVVLQYNKPDWKNWANGMIWKAMPTITFKNTLREMEIKTAKAAINTVILWKLGDHKEGLIPILEDYERLADMLKAPSSTLNVIWNSAISAEVIQPKISEIFDTARWAELRKEVTAQFGITQSVVTGEGGNFSSSFISVQGLLEKLETIRDILVEAWLMPDLIFIQKAMSFRKLPQVKFGEMSLRDENAANNFIVGLYDRGLISDETLYEKFEHDYEIERERLLNEKKWEEANDFDRRGPYIKVPEQDKFDNKQFEHEKKKGDKEFELQRDQLDHSKKLDEKKLVEDTKLKKIQMKETIKMKKQVLKQKNKNGRPPGSGSPQTKKRAKKPKNLASRLDVEKLIDNLDKNIKDYLVSTAGVSDVRSLSQKSKESIVDMVGIALSQVDDLDATTVASTDFIKTLDSSKYGTSEFAKQFALKVSDFTNTNNRKPTKDEIYKLFVDAYMES